MFFAIVLLIAVAVLAWTWAGVCIRKERAELAREYGEMYGPKNWPLHHDTEDQRDEMYAAAELRQLRNEASA